MCIYKHVVKMFRLNDRTQFTRFKKIIIVIFLAGAFIFVLNVFYKTFQSLMLLFMWIVIRHAMSSNAQFFSIDYNKTILFSHSQLSEIISKINFYREKITKKPSLYDIFFKDPYTDTKFVL